MWPVLDIVSEHLRRRKDLATIPLDIETAPRVYVEVHPGTRPTEKGSTVSKEILPGDPFASTSVAAEERLLARLEEKYAHEIMDDEERQELRDRILAIRREEA
jgi:hypothetical protein